MRLGIEAVLGERRKGRAGLGASRGQKGWRDSGPLCLPVRLPCTLSLLHSSLLFTPCSVHRDLDL